MQVVNRPDGLLAYTQSGHGPDVVWLAAGDHPGHNWRRYQTPAFDADFRSTTYDARGVGVTVSYRQPPWPIELHGDDCIALIEHVCEPPVLLVGLSMGSLIGQYVACHRPDLVRCAVLMGTCVAKTGFLREWERAEIDLHSAGRRLPAGFAITHYALLHYPAEALGDDRLWAEVRPLIAKDFGSRNQHMLAAQWQACLDFDSSTLLDSCQVPIHAVAFSEDVQTPPQRVHEVAERAPDGHFHLLEGLGHGSAFGHRPDVVNHCIRTIFEANLRADP